MSQESKKVQLSPYLSFGTSVTSPCPPVRKEKILPVITLVLYFGKEHWNVPINLRDTLKIPKVIEKYVNDYKIHVFEISWLSDKQISMFKSDFRLVADFFVKRRTDPDYIPKDRTKIKHVEEMLKLLSALTGDNGYEEVLSDSDIEEVDTMCEVAERLRNMGKAEGIADTLFSLVQDGDLSIEKASEKMQVTVQEFEKQMIKSGYKLTATV